MSEKESMVKDCVDAPGIDFSSSIIQPSLPQLPSQMPFNLADSTTAYLPSKNIVSCHERHSARSKAALECLKLLEQFPPFDMKKRMVLPEALPVL